MRRILLIIAFAAAFASAKMTEQMKGKSPKPAERRANKHCKVDFEIGCYVWILHEELEGSVGTASLRPWFSLGVRRQSW